jgi:hypothetical protein
MGRYPRCGRRDPAPVASRYDQEQRPKIRVIVAIFSYLFFGLAVSSAIFRIEASVEMGAISFVRMTIMRDRSKAPLSTSAFEQLST